MPPLKPGKPRPLPFVVFSFDRPKSGFGANWRLPGPHGVRKIFRKTGGGHNHLNMLEVRAGIEPAYADLQSAASPLCHRTLA